jgi:hypothetical protein
MERARNGNADPLRLAITAFPFACRYCVGRIFRAPSVNRSWGESL